MTENDVPANAEAEQRLLARRRWFVVRVADFLASRPRSITVDTASEVQPPVRPTEVLIETTFEKYDLWTSRIADFRGAPEREAWFEERWEALASPRRVWLFPETWPPHDDDDRWIRLDIARGSRGTMAWLASIFKRDCAAVFLSDDGERLVAFDVITGLDFVHASEHTVKSLREIRAARVRLHALLEPIAPRYLCLSRPPLAPRWTLDRVFRGEPTTTLPLSARATRRDAWLRDCSARVGAATPADAVWRDTRNVSLGASSAVPWWRVVDGDGLLLPTLWNAGRLDRILVATGDLEYVVGIRVEAGRYAAYAQNCAK